MWVGLLAPEEKKYIHIQHCNVFIFIFTDFLEQAEWLLVQAKIQCNGGTMTDWPMNPKKACG